MVASEQHLYQTIILPRKLITGSIHDYLLCYCPLAGILYEVLRIRMHTGVSLKVEHDTYYYIIKGLPSSLIGVRSVHYGHLEQHIVQYLSMK